MNANQYAALEAKIQDWVDEWCDQGDWPEVIVGDRTVEFMASAARSVFDACVESQQFAIRQGYVRETTATTSK